MTNHTNGHSQPTYKPVTHVIFDLDGLLLNSEECYHKIDEAVIGKYGKTVPDDLFLQILGFSDIDCARKIIEICDLPTTPKQYQHDVLRHTCLLRDVKLLPGAERLVRHLAMHNVPMAIATSSGRESVQNKLHNHGELFSLMSHIVMGSTDPEVQFGKPAPDCFLVCAKRFPDNPNAEQCLVLEDAPSGVTAARRAGMQVVLVPNERVGLKEREGATLVLNSLLEFRPEDFGLPPFDNSD